MSFASARRAEPPPNNSIFCRSEPRVCSGAESFKNKENPTLIPSHGGSISMLGLTKEMEILNQITWQSTRGKTSKSASRWGDENGRYLPQSTQFQLSGGRIKSSRCSEQNPDLMPSVKWESTRTLLQGCKVYYFSDFFCRTTFTGLHPGGEQSPHLPT